MDELKLRIIKWLRSKSKEDIVYVKKNYELTLFGKHIGITEFDVEQIVEKPEERIKKVEVSESHSDRLLVVRVFSKKFDTIYIILNPFNEDIEDKFKGKVAVVTVYPSKSDRS